LRFGPAARESIARKGRVHAKVQRRKVQDEIRAEPSPDVFSFNSPVIYIHPAALNAVVISSEPKLK
jgi:hypothetical protein